MQRRRLTRFSSARHQSGMSLLEIIIVIVLFCCINDLFNGFHILQGQYFFFWQLIDTFL